MLVYSCTWPAYYTYGTHIAAQGQHIVVQGKHVAPRCQHIARWATYCRTWITYHNAVAIQLPMATIPTYYRADLHSAAQCQHMAAQRRHIIAQG